MKWEKGGERKKNRMGVFKTQTLCYSSTYQIEIFWGKKAEKRNSSRSVESRKLLVDGKQRKQCGELALELPVEMALPE